MAGLKICLFLCSAGGIAPGSRVTLKESGNQKSVEDKDAVLKIEKNGRMFWFKHPAISELFSSNTLESYREQARVFATGMKSSFLFNSVDVRYFQLLIKFN